MTRAKRDKQPWYWRTADLAARSGRYLALLLILVLLAATGRADVLGSLPSTDRVLTFLLISILLLVFYVLILLRRGDLQKPPSSSQDDAPDAVVRAAWDTEWFDVGATLDVLADPRHYFLRTRESVRVLDGYYEHRLSTTFRVPRRSSAQRKARPCLVPILRIPRGSLVDNLQVTSSNGDLISVVSSSAARGVLHQLATTWLAAITDPREFRAKGVSFVEGLIGELSIDGPIDIGADRSRLPSEKLNESIGFIRSLRRPPQSALDRRSWQKRREQLIDLLTSLRETYPVFACVDGAEGSLCSLRFAYTRQASADRLSWRDYIRHIFGLRPYQHSFLVDGYRFAQSYHLRFLAPDHQYVHATELLGSSQIDGARISRSHDRGVLVLPHPGTGSVNYSHVYVRPPSRGMPAVAKLAFRFTCHETPPGLLGVVAVVALAQAILIWTIGFFHDDFFPPNRVVGSGALTAQSGLPTVLLALPGLMATWLATQFVGDKLKHTSLATVWGVICAGIIAIASVSLALAKIADANATGTWRIPLGPEWGHPGWSILMVSSALLAIDLCARTASRSIAYTLRANAVERWHRMSV